MNIDLITVGKVKEKYLQDAIDEYAKRLSRYVKMSIIEIPEEKAKEPLSRIETHHILDKEGRRILQALNPDSYCIALVIEGKTITSAALARKLEDLTTYGQSHITFLIGGSYGLSREVITKAHYLLSFSAFTYPHQLMRVLLLEQVYRSCKINRGETYHK